MLFDIKDKIIEFITDRFFFLYIVVLILAGILISKLFDLQIVHGNDYLND